MVVISIIMILVELWWVAAFVYAYGQLRKRRLLVQAAQGLLIGLFFLMLAINAINGQAGISAAQVMALLLALLSAVIWRTVQGPQLLRERYTNRLADVLRFRRPAVDMRRRVRTR